MIAILYTKKYHLDPLISYMTNWLLYLVRSLKLLLRLKKYLSIFM